jgi:spore coat polysaccharide biosynthesis protein SpsF (cytidylyltransferase family)
MKTAFVICSRRDSSRVPNKCFIKYEGLTHIEHLIERLLDCDLPIYIAVPEGEEQFYAFLADKYSKRVKLFAGFGDDPMRRMLGVMKENQLDSAIRVTHDKIFVDTDLVWHMLGQFNSKNLDYAYSGDFIPGTGFEIISRKSIEAACEKYKRVEHISYAIKSVTNSIEKIPLPAMREGLRLLVDYPEDVELMTLLFATLGANATLDDVIKLTSDHPWITSINQLPEATIYTCAYNAEKWITDAMGSAASQLAFGRHEYILIDDHSTDGTPFLMAKFCQNYRNVKWLRNEKNIGLASSSNRALRAARGKYIIRLDADDFFTNNLSLENLIESIEEQNVDVIYPNNYLGVARNKIQNGKEHHHIGGALFRTAAINHVKFTEGLRNWDGLDFFSRARKQIKIGYLNSPTFVYRQHEGSMSKINLEERAEQKEKISAGMLNTSADSLMSLAEEFCSQDGF